MAEIPKNLKCLLFPVGARVMAICAFALEILGLACLVMGIITDVQQKVLWMDPLCWFYLAIALFIYGLWWWLAGYFAAKEE
jgi:putative exporter of polyketide antibiotics